MKFHKESLLHFLFVCNYSTVKFTTSTLEIFLRFVCVRIISRRVSDLFDGGSFGGDYILYTSQGGEGVEREQANTHTERERKGGSIQSLIRRCIVRRGVAIEPKEPRRARRRCAVLPLRLEPSAQSPSSFEPPSAAAVRCVCALLLSKLSLSLFSPPPPLYTHINPRFASWTLKPIARAHPHSLSILLCSASNGFARAQNQSETAGC